MKLCPHGAWALSFLFMLASCTTIESSTVTPTTHVDETEHEHTTEAEMLSLPELETAVLDNQPLQVIATTSIIGDVVAQVGGDAISLTVLVAPGQDPHSYEPAPQDLTAVNDAHVIFVNGWNLEEGLADDLAVIGADIPVVPVSANIEPLAFDDQEQQDERDRGAVDPHTWFGVRHVEQWVANIEHVLTALDPAHAETYAHQATTYLHELQELEAYIQAQLATIPTENRILVTNHDSFGYFAQEYGFEILGTVLPANSTVAEPSASNLAALIAVMEEHAICTIFTETTVNDELAQTVADELSGCDEVQILKLYTGATGPPGSGADSYIGMFRANVDTIVAGLE